MLFIQILDNALCCVNKAGCCGVITNDNCAYLRGIFVILFKPIRKRRPLYVFDNNVSVLFHI